MYLARLPNLETLVIDPMQMAEDGARRLQSAALNCRAVGKDRLPLSAAQAAPIAKITCLAAIAVQPPMVAAPDVASACTSLP